jgi:hypothetical protein
VKSDEVGEIGTVMCECRSGFGHHYIDRLEYKRWEIWLNIVAFGHCCYDITMLNISDVGTAVDGSIGFASAEQLASHARCLWCRQTFTPRSTGGSAQKFCCTGHRQQFWIAARRWTMRAIEAGLLSVDCLKPSHTSVHAI